MSAMKRLLLVAAAVIAGSAAAVTGQQRAGTPPVTVPPMPRPEDVAAPTGWKPGGHIVPPMPLTLARLPRTAITKARYPAIDFHVHGPDLTTDAAYKAFVATLDRIGVGAIANMDGGTGAHLDAALKAGEPYRDRVATFITLNLDGINEPGWSQKFAAEMERGFKAGALGLKAWKTIGLTAKNPDGSYIQADDPRFDPIWAMAAKHDRPVLIHLSDSIGRFYPISPKNERFEAGLWAKPGDVEGNYYQTGHPSHETIEKAREAMHRKHPKTRFVNAHMAMLYYDTEKLGRFLDTHPNADVEISASVQDLGRAPRLWREFILKYQDRILMGSDGDPGRGVDDFWTPHWRFLETYDEHFEHPAQMRTEGGSPGHGRWNISGVGLPDAVLRKIYYQNALRHLPVLKGSIERQLAARSR
jgi:predicted TIM-barrel fold metal-dependent hydrolase